MSSNYIQKATGASPAGLTDSLIFDNGTNVGIGNAAPSYPLDISGSVRFTNAGGVQPNYWFRDLGGSALLYLYSAGAQKVQIATDGNATYFGVGGGNVGIGTTGPDAKLMVQGNEVATQLKGLVHFDVTQATNYPILNLTNTNGGGNAVDHQGLQVDVRGNGDGLYVANNATPILIAKTNGNVGIGTTSPGQKLSVAGTIEATSGGFKFPDGTTQTSAASGGSGQWTTSGSNIYNNNAGNVGVGTSSPGTLLDVNGIAVVGGLVPHSGDLILDSHSSSHSVVLKINGAAGATLNGAGLGVGTAVDSDAAAAGWTKISDGYIGINTDFWMRPSQCGSLAACSPLTVSKTGGSGASPDSRVAQFWHENNTGTGVTIAAFASNNDNTNVGNDTRVGYLSTVGHGAANYLFVGQDENGGTLGGDGTFFVVDNKGRAAFGKDAGGTLSLIGPGGTINVSGDVYHNGTAYPHDYVLEHWATGAIQRFKAQDVHHYQGLSALRYVEVFVREHFSLPRIAEARGPSGELGIFSGGGGLLASVEEAYLYMFDLDHRLTAVEAKLSERPVVEPDPLVPSVYRAY